MIRRLVRVCVCGTVAAALLGLVDRLLLTRVAADSFGLVPGHLVVSRSTYPNPGPAIAVGQALPGSKNATAFTAISAATPTSGSVLSVSGLKAGNLVQITTAGTTSVVTLVTVSSGSLTLTWTPALAASPSPGDRIAQVATATADGSYPGVWANETPDPSFGVTTPIFLDQLTTAGVPVSTLAVDPAQIVTSFSSKSELALNLSSDGSALTFMGYAAPVNAIDVSNANTPNHVDPTNLTGVAATPRAVARINLDGSLQVSPVNAYSGNNGRAVALASGNYYLVGNAGNSGNGTDATTLSALSDNTGVQMIAAGGSGETTVVGQVQGTFGGGTGYQRGFSIAQPPLSLPPDKTGKDDNFRGLTIFNNTLYVSKGSGSNGVNTVYQVGATGSLPTLANAGTMPIAILPGFSTTLARSTTGVVLNPFGLWFANANTLYVADEGSGTATNPNAGLQKWTFDGTSWTLRYVLQGGLNRDVPYVVPGYTGPAPAADGLRNLTGLVNADGTVTLWATTSTISTNTDQGADPNQLVTITDTLANTVDPGAAEAFTLLRTANAGEVLRGVAYLPVPADFSMAVNPNAAVIQGGGSITATVSTADTAGTASTITLGASNLPSGVTASFNPAAVTAGQSAVLTLTADSTVAFNPTGTSITISGGNANFTHSATMQLATLSGGVTVGSTGPQGPAGPKGDTGATGAQGPIGPAGPPGASGPQGPAGPMGLQGPSGPAGGPGPVGATGATGPIGATGPRGATGPIGLPGPAGPKGTDGSSVPAGTVIFLLEGVPAPAGYTLIGTFTENVRTGDGDRDDRQVTLTFRGYRKN